MKKKARWRTLQHNGILFPPVYETKGIGIKIGRKSISLSLLCEEMVYQWAKKKDTPYASDPVFRKNFTNDLAAELGPGYAGLSYDEIDFSDAYGVVDEEKKLRESMTKEAKKSLAAERKELKMQLKAKYGTALINGKEVEVGNYMAEPPGIFIGRGAHPLRGRWKPRITEEDVTLNMSRNANFPEGSWNAVVENKEVMWLARWTDFLTQKEKYIWLADTADLKQNTDKAKYVKAERLASEIDKILDVIASDMEAEDDEAENDDRKRKIATACYLIYRTAMRVGDEKDPDEADTVGATTLRKEHVVITSNSIKFDFLGKDSVRWKETLKVETAHDKLFRDNLAEFIRGKRYKDEIFADIKSSNVNKYYSGIVEGLSAKVFRTYSATKVVREYLKEHLDLVNSTPAKKIHHAKLANLEAAKMCNHKRTIPKNFDESIKKREARLEEIKAKEPWVKTQERLEKAKGTKPKTAPQKKKKRERVKKLKLQMTKQRSRHDERVERLRLQIELAKKTKDYNLGTSLRNYIDPRVVKAWTDETKTEWEKLYTAALQKKFLWVHKEKTKWSDFS